MWRLAIRIAGATIAVCTLVVLGFWLRQRTQTRYDLILRGATIVNGKGGRPYRADVGVIGGRIWTIGRLRWARAEDELDLDGLVLAPRFIGVHTHIERNIPSACGPFKGTSFTHQGVTTLITDDCSTSDAPPMRLLSATHCKPQVNLARFVGYNSPRERVMGKAERQPSPQELGRMRELVRAAMRQGALGLSIGLAYPPGMFAEINELAALAHVAAAYRGTYVTYIRDEAARRNEAIRAGDSGGD